MFAIDDIQLDAYLDRVLQSIAQMRDLDLSVEDDLEEALAQSRDIMGALAMYRSRLQRTGQPATRPMRKAA